MEAREVFGQNLRRLRARSGLTQEDLAALCGCRQTYISSMETGIFAPSMKILQGLAKALGVVPAELLMVDRAMEERVSPSVGIPILNERSRSGLPSPKIHEGRVQGDSSRVFCTPGLGPEEAFAAYAPDDSMSPEFNKGDLIVFSLTREPGDGDACLVAVGESEAVIRTVLRLGGGRWRLQPASAKFAHETVKEGKGLRMWPAIGRWQMLPLRRRG